MSIKISLSLWLGVLAVVAEIHGQGQPSYQPIHYDVGNYPDSNTGLLLTDLNNGANPDSLGPNGWTPLHIAAGLNKPEMAKLLKLKNANLNIKDLFNYAPLHIAAGVGSDGVINKLVPGADTEIKGPSDWTPLHVAAGNGKVSAVRELLINANKNPVDVNGWTPLHIAVGVNQLLAAQELLNKPQT
jgi:ankyrin repeat protein